MKRRARCLVLRQVTTQVSPNYLAYVNEPVASALLVSKKTLFLLQGTSGNLVLSENSIIARRAGILPRIMICELERAEN